jgi:hypothetical protein
MSNMSITGKLIASRCNGTRYIGAAMMTPPRHCNCEPMPIPPSHQPQSQGPDAIDTIVVGGTTEMPERLFCGWHVLSPPCIGGSLHGGQITIKMLAPLTNVADDASARLGATEDSQIHEFLEVRTTALCNNKGDNANIALGIKQLRVLC